MYGWIVTNFDIGEKNMNLPSFDMSFRIDGLLFCKRHNGRFHKDSVFLENDSVICLIDGVVLNKSELENEFKKDFTEIVLDLLKNNLESFPEHLRGVFSGVIYVKSEKKVFAFTNHTADSGVFYYSGDKILIGNNYRWIAEIIKKNNVEFHLDMDAVKNMCIFGYMITNNTYFDNIKRLLPSQYILKDESNVVKVGEYFKFTNTKVSNLSEEETIEHLDMLFRRAIKREFEKDLEYGYTSVVDLSGGLDSRVVNYVAKSMGYTDIVNISFSQSFSDEYKAMIELSRDLGFRLIHYPLDNARHLFDLDKTVSKNYGLSYYAGAGSIYAILENLNLDVYGLEHGGTLGDMSDGVFPGRWYKEHEKATFEKGMPFCRVFSTDILDDSILDKFENLEMFTVFGRGMLGGACTHLIRREFTGFTMPFGDVDFYSFFLSIPLHMRGDGEILKKWISKKYPQAFDVIEDKLMCKPNASKFVKKAMLFRRKVYGKLNQYFGELLPKIAMNNMNPMEYWYKNNRELREFIRKYYESNIHRVSEYEEAKDMLETLYNSGDLTGKFICLTILSFVKQFFGE